MTNSAPSSTDAERLDELGEEKAPVHTQSMDDDLRGLWESLGPLPDDVRLYGGTAVALYCNHRASVDLAFATPRGLIDRGYPAKIPVLKDSPVRGGPGMIDVRFQGPNREITVTFMECGSFMVPPTQPPTVAANGVQVAHPVDLAVMKMMACCSREALRDYVDLAEMIRVWPRTLEKACRIVIEQGHRRDKDIARTLSDPPPGVRAKLAAPARTSSATIHRLSSTSISGDCVFTAWAFR